jgi:hypothetical protein
MRSPAEFARRWGQGGAEPPIEDMLSDPVIEAVLRHDGLTREDVLAVIEAARLRIGGRVV